MNEQKITKIGNFIGRLILGAYADKIVETATKVGNIEKTLDTLVITMSGHDRDIAGIKVKVYGNPGSPMQPNENGKKLLQDSGFNDAYPLIKDELFAVLDQLNTRTLYDAEKNAKIVLNQLSGKVEFDSLKNYAVNHPDEPLDLIFNIASWVIRDDYAKAKGIALSK